jgi:transcriptional regulator with XRE-family HTH domain
MNGLTDTQVCEKLDISKNTLGNWKRRLHDTGSLEKSKVIRTAGKPYKYTPDKLKELMEKSKEANNTSKATDDKLANTKSTNTKAKEPKHPDSISKEPPKENGADGLLKSKPKKKKRKKRQRHFNLT